MCSKIKVVPNCLKWQKKMVRNDFLETITITTFLSHLEHIETYIGPTELPTYQRIQLLYAANKQHIYTDMIRIFDILPRLFSYYLQNPYYLL